MDDKRRKLNALNSLVGKDYDYAQYADGGQVEDDDDQDEPDQDQDAPEAEAPDKSPSMDLGLSDEDKQKLVDYVQAPDKERQARLDAINKMMNQPMSEEQQKMLEGMAMGPMGAMGTIEEISAPIVKEGLAEAAPIVKKELENISPELMNKLESLYRNPSQSVSLTGNNALNTAKWLKLKELLGLTGPAIRP